jgi:anion-transporting  ArsA/GET3 family ATPase
VAGAHSLGRAALVEFGDGESGKRALGKARRSVDHLVIAPGEAITRAAAPLFGGGMIARVALGNFAVNRLMKAAPAVRELAMLECVRLVAEERPERRVVVDLPATGHGLAWLRVPAQIRDATGSGPLYEMTDRIVTELLSPTRCSIVVVTLPERLVLQETLELCDTLRKSVGIPPARLMINRVPPSLPRQALAEAKALAESLDPLADHALELQLALEARISARDEALAALAEASAATHLAPVVLPEAAADPTASEVAEWLRGEEAG